jgi:hypothetical protein
MDYSHLKEPDYDYDQFKQSAESTDWIQRTGEQVMENWQNREAIAEHLRNKKESHKRRRRIFYDTDNIQEIQDEEIVLCDGCGGALKIESEAKGRPRILAVHVPVKSCPTCQDRALQWYETANADQFDHIFLQNRVDDSYLQRK